MVIPNPSFLSKRVKRRTQSGITSDRYQFLGLDQAEPDLGDPLVGPSSVGVNPYLGNIPDSYILISDTDKSGNRYWIKQQDLVSYPNLTGDIISIGSATSISNGAIINSDINDSAEIADTKLATISTAGKVLNSATTATSSNTNNAIVARNSSGGFSAGVITATSFTGSGANLTALNASQLTTGTVANARLSGTYTGISINTAGVVTATSFTGSGANLTSLNATQLTTGTVPDARLSGIYTGFTVNTTGVITATSFTGSGANLTSLNATQLTTGTVPDARLSGTYTGISVNTAGVITATSFSGSGANLTALNASQLTTGTVPDARLSGTYTGISVNTAGVITATSFSGSGTNLTALNASNLSSGTIANARLSGTYTGISVNTAGVITATSFSGSGTNLTALNASQLTTGTVPDARLSGIYTGFTINTAGVITATSFTGSGTNLTSLNATQLTTGTVPDARLSGIYTSFTINTTGVITATSFSGSGANLTAINASNISSGTLNNSRLPSNISVSGIITASQVSTGALGTGINITTNTISGPSELIIDPAAVGDNTGAVRIRGDLFVDGTQTVINSATIELADFNVGIATTVGTNALLDGAGIGIGSVGIRKTITWNNSSSSIKSSENLDISSGKTYKINGTDILSSNTLGSGVVNSSLTSVGILGQLNVSGIATVNQLDVNQLSPDGVNFGLTAYVPVANGSGGWSWATVASAGAGNLNGIDIRDEGTIVGTAGSTTSIDFRGNNITATGTAGGSISTVRVSDTPTFDTLNVSGVSTASRFISTVTTGTAPLTVTSTSLVTNLNADLLDGQQGSYYNDLTNATGTVANARLSGIYTSFTVNTTGVITATSFSGSGTNLTALNATQLTTGTVPDARLSGIYTGFTINTAGVITATSFSGSGTNLTSINASNLSSGTLPDARLSGTYTGISVNTAGVITATSFSGSGANLTSLNASQLTTGTVPDARLSGTYTGISVNTTGVITATSFSGSGANLTTLNASNISSGTLNNSRLPSNINISGVITASQVSTGALGTGINITTNTISGPSEITIDPAAVGDNTGAVRIRGDLFVDGTQTVINSTTIELADFNVGIATTVGTNVLLDGAGIGIGSTGIRKTITWNNTAGALTSSEDWNLASGKQYEINGTSVLSSNTLGSGVVNSSLTSVGILGQLNVSGISTASRFISNVATGTAPLTVASTTLVTNLNADLLDNQQGSYYNDLTNATGTLSDARLSGTYTGISINTTGVVTATSFSGSGANLTSLNASNISSGTLNNSRLPQDINVSGIVTTNSLNIGLDVGISTTRTILATIAETTIDSFSILTFRSAKIQIQITQGTDYQISDLLVIHDGVEASLVECGSIATNQYLGNFSAIVSGNNCLVRVSMNTSSSATIKLLSQRFTI